MLIAQTGKGLIYIYIAAPAFLPRQHIRNSSLGPALPRSKVTATLQTESKQKSIYSMNLWVTLNVHQKAIRSVNTAWIKHDPGGLENRIELTESTIESQIIYGFSLRDRDGKSTWSHVTAATWRSCGEVEKWRWSSSRALLVYIVQSWWFVDNSGQFPS